jgi:hypothetical protein
MKPTIPSIFFVKTRLKPLTYTQVKNPNVVEVRLQSKLNGITLWLVATVPDEFFFSFCGYERQGAKLCYKPNKHFRKNEHIIIIR